MDLHILRNDMVCLTDQADPMSTRHFLDRLFGTCNQGLVEVRAAPSGRRTWTDLGQWNPLGPFVTNVVNARQNVYVGLATRRDTTNGTAANLLELPMLWTDIDAPPQVVRQRLEGFPFRWSLFVGSGCGAHLYYQLREPLDVSQQAGLSRAASLLRRLTAYLGGDDRATNPAATPRLVGTRNYKYGAPQPVTLVDETSTTLNACELEDFLPAEIVRRNEFTIAGWIPVGCRNDMLYRLVRSLRAQGLPFPTITHTVRTLNETQCEVPLPDLELRQLLHHALVQPNRPDFRVPSTIVHDAHQHKPLKPP